MLSNFLGVAAEFSLHLLVLFASPTSPPGTSERANGDFTVFKSRQNLGRRGHNGEVIQVHKIHVRRGIKRAQRSVQRERMSFHSASETLRQNYLHRIASSNVLLNRLNMIQKLRLTIRRLKITLVHGR